MAFTGLNKGGGSSKSHNLYYYCWCSHTSFYYNAEPNQQGGGLLNGHSAAVDGDTLLAQGRILDGLGTWIDRLFDGSLPKCKVERWPIYPVEEPSDTDDRKDR